MNAYRMDPWAALGDPTRRAIFERVATRPRAVVELAAGLSVSRPAVSQHLKVLRDAGLVVAEPVGARRVYRVDPEGLAVLRAQIERFWGDTLQTYQEIVEQPNEEMG